MIRFRALAAAAIAAAVLVPTMAAGQAAPADTALVASIVTPCARVTAAERATPLADNAELACFRAISAAIDESAATTAAQENVGLAILAALDATSGPDRSVTSPSGAAIAAAVDLRVFGSCALGAAPNLQACLAATRIAIVVTQGTTADDATRIANDICLGSGRDATWQSLVFAIIDELIARAATGTDPVMQDNILPVLEARRTCPVMG